MILFVNFFYRKKRKHKDKKKLQELAKAEEEEVKELVEKSYQSSKTKAELAFERRKKKTVSITLKIMQEVNIWKKVFSSLNSV